MDKIERAGLIKNIVSTIEESIVKYDAAGKYPVAGCNVSMYDSRESIKRRCIMARQELLNLMKSLEEN